MVAHSSTRTTENGVRPIKESGWQCVTRSPESPRLSDTDADSELPQLAESMSRSAVGLWLLWYWQIAMAWQCHRHYCHTGQCYRYAGFALLLVPIAVATLNRQCRVGVGGFQSTSNNQPGGVGRTIASHSGVTYGTTIGTSIHSSRHAAAACTCFTTRATHCIRKGDQQSAMMKHSEDLMDVSVVAATTHACPVAGKCPADLTASFRMPSHVLL